MGETYLTYEQNICSAIIFLNTFGLILEEQDNINELSKLNIYDDKKDSIDYNKIAMIQILIMLLLILHLIGKMI